MVELSYLLYSISWNSRMILINTGLCVDSSAVEYYLDVKFAPLVRVQHSATRD